MHEKTIDLNCDMGESFGVYSLGMDDQVMPYISSANIACGWHAGDPLVMKQTINLAVSAGVGCGAHPGYPDRMGFGRRAMAVSAEELYCYLVYQIGAISAFCNAAGVPLRHVKPHGSLYLTAVEDEKTADAVARAIVDVNPALIYVALAGRKGGMMARIGRGHGLKLAYEGFPDRAYTPEGTLVPRSQPGAVIHDPQEVMRRAVCMATQGCIQAVNGDMIELQVDTLCVHGDNPKAALAVRGIRQALTDAQVRVCPMDV